MSHPAPPQLPPPGAVLTVDKVDNYLETVQRWSAETGAKLLDLDARLGTLPMSSQQDHTLAFVVWQAADQCIAQAVGSQSAFPEKRLEPLRGPLFASDRSTLAASLDEALQIIRALIDSTQGAINTHEGTIAATADIVADLAAAAPLVKSLSMSVALHSQLMERVGSPALKSDPAALGRLSSEAASLLDNLRAADQERTKLLAELPHDSARLEALRLLESEAQSIVETSVAKVSNQPKMGIVSVEALGPAPDIHATTDTPWPAQRNLLHARSTRLARAEASLRQVISVHTKLLAERNELRQVVDAFRAKAMAARIGELPEVSAAYDQARLLLWSAPTDLVAAREAVSRYQTTVSTHMTSHSVLRPALRTSNQNRPANEVPR
jgi:hypothetical protein